MSTLPALCLFDLDGTLVSEEDGVDEATALVAEELRQRGHSVSDALLGGAVVDSDRSDGVSRLVSISSLFTA